MENMEDFHPNKENALDFFYRFLLKNFHKETKKENVEFQDLFAFCFKFVGKEKQKKEEKEKENEKKEREKARLKDLEYKFWAAKIDLPSKICQVDSGKMREIEENFSSIEKELQKMKKKTDDWNELKGFALKDFNHKCFLIPLGKKQKRKSIVAIKENKVIFFIFI